MMNMSEFTLKTCP